MTSRPSNILDAHKSYRQPQSKSWPAQFDVRPPTAGQSRPAPQRSGNLRPQPRPVISDFHTPKPTRPAKKPIQNSRPAPPAAPPPLPKSILNPVNPDEPFIPGSVRSSHFLPNFINPPTAE